MKKKELANGLTTKDILISLKKWRNNMNRKQYNSDSRYRKVLEQMDLLQIMDITTTRQAKNGTIVWKLPIKNDNSGKTNIEVASFKTGYVRNNNSGYSNYQLNKRCDGEPEYFKLANGDYRRFSTRSCILIPIEIDRLEYLISYCLKNYYIKRANEVSESFDCGHYERIRNLEVKLDTIQRISDHG
jgi:hypothetical protein